MHKFHSTTLEINEHEQYPVNAKEDNVHHCIVRH